MSRLTAADVLRSNNGVGPGFDAQRLGLSVWVFTLHAMFICQGADVAEQFAADPLHRILISPVMPMFFMVSGYLVTGSAIRTKTLSTFLTFRILRIVPALLVETTLSALILGPWLTEKSLSEYFSDLLFPKYFLNVIGNVQYFLPGLFVHNPIQAVNINLWTLKPEFYCYIFMSIMILSGLIFNKILFSIFSGISLSALLGYEIIRGQLYNYLAVADWKMLIVSFFLGCLAYHWSDWFVLSKRNVLIAIFIACVAFTYSPLTLLGFPALIYLVVYIGMKRYYLPRFFRKGDYSYGILSVWISYTTDVGLFSTIGLQASAEHHGLGFADDLAFCNFFLERCRETDAPVEKSFLGGGCVAARQLPA